MLVNACAKLVIIFVFPLAQRRFDCADLRREKLCNGQLAEWSVRLATNFTMARAEVGFSEPAKLITYARTSLSIVFCAM